MPGGDVCEALAAAALDGAEGDDGPGIDGHIGDGIGAGDIIPARVGV